MKTIFFNPALLRGCATLFALLCCLAFNRAQAQYIPVDSMFAVMLVQQVPAAAACILNNQMDTTCAKALTFSNLGFGDLQGIPGSGPDSLNGLQYVGKNMEGSPVGNRTFSGSGFGLKYIPDLPSIYWQMHFYEVPNLEHLPHPGYSAERVSMDARGGIRTMPVLPPSVTRLVIGNTALTEIPAPLPFELNFLSCAANESLAALPILPHTIKFLDLRYGEFTSLPNLPDSLEYFECFIGKLTSLPALPAGVQEIYCNDNQIALMPAAADLAELRMLNCASNQLTVLPELSNSPLKLLNFSNNHIRTLPRLSFALPDSVMPGEDPLIDIYAFNNELDSITNFPFRVDSFIAHNNNLSSLPALSNLVRLLDLRTNSIIYLPPVTDTVRWLRIDSNPIACLPVSFTGTGVTLSETNISCLPDNWMIVDTVSPDLPICSGQQQACIYETVNGRVYYDKNNNCVYDNGDVPARNYLIKLSNNAYCITDSLGKYEVPVIPGNYSVALKGVLYPYSFNCTDSIRNFSYADGDTIATLDFPLKADFDCAVLNVDISAALIRVAVPNTHYVMVFNSGSDTATNVVLDIKFDPELTPLSSIPIWDIQLSDNILRYNIGTLAPTEEVRISIRDSASITSIPGQTACVMARVHGDNVCGMQASALWDSSNIEVLSKWEEGEDSIQFCIRNTGNNMLGAHEYRIYEEELLMFRGSFQLTRFDSIIVKAVANGHTYRVEADQHPYFPGLSMPRQFVELAGGPALSVHHIVPVPQDDKDPWVEIDCHEIVNAFDPNEKQVFPSGVGANHYVTATDDLDYVLMFQNTGSDTAFNIRLIDTLDAQRLDIESFRSGVSSHPYTVSMQGNGVVTWRFANILLPDSHVNEPLSHGFVKFKIKQRAGNQPGIVINNFVDIFFDYNTAVRTNTAFVTIEEKERIFNAIVEAHNVDNGYTINVMPNPFADQATFIVNSKSKNADNYTFELFDITGRNLQSRNVQGTFTINRDGLHAGIYLFKLTENGKPVGNGKLVIK